MLHNIEYTRKYNYIGWPQNAFPVLQWHLLPLTFFLEPISTFSPTKPDPSSPPLSFPTVITSSLYPYPSQCSYLPFLNSKNLPVTVFFSSRPIHLAPSIWSYPSWLTVQQKSLALISGQSSLQTKHPLANPKTTCWVSSYPLKLQVLIRSEMSSARHGDPASLSRLNGLKVIFFSLVSTMKQTFLKLSVGDLGPLGVDT